MASQRSVTGPARTNNKDKWAHHSKWLLMGCRRQLVGGAGWAPYVNSSLITPNWSNLFESCVGTCAPSSRRVLTRAEPCMEIILHLCGCFLGLRQKWGKKEAAKRKRELSAARLGLFIIFRLMLLVLRREEDKDLRRLDVNERNSEVPGDG